MLDRILDYVPNPLVLAHVLFSVHWCIGIILTVTIVGSMWIYGGTKGALISVLAGYIAILALPMNWSQSVAPSTYDTILIWMPYVVAYFMLVGGLLRVLTKALAMKT